MKNLIALAVVSLSLSQTAQAAGDYELETRDFDSAVCAQATKTTTPLDDGEGGACTPNTDEDRGDV